MTPHDSLSMEYDATYYISGLFQYSYLTNKPNHFKKMSGSVTQNILKIEMYTFQFAWFPAFQQKLLLMKIDEYANTNLHI